MRLPQASKWLKLLCFLASAEAGAELAVPRKALVSLHEDPEYGEAGRVKRP